LLGVAGAGLNGGVPLRRFELHRDRDVSGVSGTGVVATGVCSPDPYRFDLPDGEVLDLPAGWCVIRWRGEYRSTVLWASVGDAMQVHGHHGSTRLVWVDG
jgi:hypothetical protein